MQATAYLQQFLKIGKVTQVKKELSAEKIDPILTEITEVVKKLKNIENRFDFEIDSDMIDACIYEEKALQSRYRFLLSLAKQKGLYQTPADKILSDRQKSA